MGGGDVERSESSEEDESRIDDRRGEMVLSMPLD